MATAAPTRREWTEAERRAKRRYYSLTMQHNSGMKASHVIVPDDIERVEESAPCTFCGVRAGCRHRPWMLRP